MNKANHDFPTSHPWRQSVRLPDYDYRQSGAYFITICTYERRLIFGTIADEEVHLNSIGEIAHSCCAGIKDHFPDAELSVYVIMPNHLHGIVIIRDNVAAQHAVPENVSIPIRETFGKPVDGSLPTIVRSFKSAVTRQVNERYGGNGRPIWGKGYYEHVIRNEDEYRQIGEYVLGNPVKWGIDRENPLSDRKVRLLPFEY